MKKKKELEFLCKECRFKRSRHMFGMICPGSNKKLCLWEPETNLEAWARYAKDSSTRK